MAEEIGTNLEQTANAPAELLSAEPKPSDAIALYTRDTALLHASRRSSFLMEVLLWAIWIPASLILLLFVLEHFILAEALF
jgi:hypothetical protein